MTKTVTATRSGGLVVMGLTMIASGFVALTALQYITPFAQRYAGASGPPGSAHSINWLRHSLTTHVHVLAYVHSFEMLVFVVWAGYALIIYAGLRWGIGRLCVVLAVASALAFVLAVVFPPILSRDPFAYLGYARMPVLYHLNPYATTLHQLSLLGDHAARVFPAAHSSPYGPSWSLFTAAIAWLGRGLSLSAQLVILKSIEAAALVGGAFAARSVAGVWDSRHADVAAVAFALNPLLILEGPCSGHNDLLMVALLLTGMALVLRNRWQLGFLVVGLSAGIKFVSFAIVPWLILEQLRLHKPPQPVKRAAASLGLVLLPFALSFAPFWQGIDSLSGLTAMYGMREQHHTQVHTGVWIALALYLALTAWIARGRESRLAPAWAGWSLAVSFLAIPGTLPWYFVWPIGVSVTKWDVRPMIVTVLCFWISAQWMLEYAATRIHP